jgi:hypothetical protein
VRSRARGRYLLSVVDSAPASVPGFVTISISTSKPDSELIVANHYADQHGNRGQRVIADL